MLNQVACNQEHSNDNRFIQFSIPNSTIFYYNNIIKFIRQLPDISPLLTSNN